MAKLDTHGIPLGEIACMTLKQAYYALYALTDDLEERIRIGGGKIEDEEEESRRLTIQDLGLSSPKKSK